MTYTEFLYNLGRVNAQWRLIDGGLLRDEHGCCPLEAVSGHVREWPGEQPCLDRVGRALDSHGDWYNQVIFAADSAGCSGRAALLSAVGIKVPVVIR